MSIMRTLLNIIIILCVLLNWGCTEGARKISSGKGCSQTIKVSSLFHSSSSLSSSCSLSSTASNTKSSLQLVHRHGPCSHLISGKATTSLDHDDILRRDKARVDSIHSKLSKNLLTPSQLTDLPAERWGSKTLGSGTYIVKIGIGTPKHDMSLLFDTGSDLSWVQCKPCTVHCYTQKEPIFNPALSSSYHNVSCSSPVCDSLGGLQGSCSDSTCGYSVGYGDTSTSQGFIAKEKFTLTSSDVFDGVNFGCGENNRGDYYEGVAGLLGLGPGQLSFPSQTAKTYNKIFSYCLPSSVSNTSGHLTFGSTGISKSVKFTPVSSSPSKDFYYLNIVGITVCDKQLAEP